MSIPTQLALTGSLRLTRKDALKLTGRLFKLRRDVNLVSNVLDVPDLFWEEGQASLRALYDAVRDYMEISMLDYSHSLRKRPYSFYVRCPCGSS